MKRTLFFKLALGTLITLGVVACKDKKPGLVPLSGSANEVLVIMDKTPWNGAAGDTVKAWFGQEQLGLPQPEPMFHIINLPQDFFDKSFKAYRSILNVNISPDVDSARIVFKDGPWAKTQKYYQIEAPDEASFIRIFDQYKQQMLHTFLQAEQDRLVDLYKKSPNSKIYNLFKNTYHLSLSFPAEYIINKDSTDFVWISRETGKDSKGFIFIQRPYKDIAQFQFQAIIDTVNKVLEQNIPGPLAGSYMALDTVAPVATETYNYDRTHYAVLMRGLWMVKNDYMGGPFVLNVVLDQKNNRILYLLGYVYAPEDKKRNKVREIEAILFTLDLDDQGSAEVSGK